MKFNNVPFSDLLSRVVDNRGKTCPTADDGIPLIATNCIRNDLLYPAYEKVRYVTQETYDSWFRGHPQPGDMIFVTKGSPGRVCWVPDPIDFCIAQDMVAIRADHKKVHPKYLFALLRSAETQFKIENMHVGTLIPHFKKGDFDKLILPIPEDLDYQKEAGEIYFDFCKKIELNRQINQTLEQIAQTIFKSWFVDFEPVKAKIEAKASGRDPERAAMCAISGKLEPELDQLTPENYQKLAATAALFPDELVESELGLIPAGWEVKTISDISLFATGKIGVSALSVENYISTQNMAENRGGVSHATSLPAVSTVPSFSKGQVLISNIRPYFKKIWLARFDGGRSNDVLAFNATENDCAEFLYNLLYQDEFFEFMMRTSKGAKMPRGDKAAIAGWNFPCADHSLRSFFSEKVRPYYLHIESISTEAQHLSMVRDALLPKLLSGELTDGESERQVEASP